MIEIGKVPPQALDLEEAILGALLIDKDAFDVVANIIKPESFYRDCHQKIFKAILDLEKKQEPIDLLTVSESLRKSGYLEDIGGPYYVSQLTSKVASASNIEFHARIITQKYIQRELIRVASEISSKAYDDSVDIDDLISFASNSIEQAANSTIESEDCLWADLLEQTAKQAEKREVLRKQGKTLGIKTPLKLLDQYTGGWRGGDLILIGARPSMGKTAISVAIMKECAKNGGCPNFYSLETTKIKITDRILAGEAGVNYENYTMGYMTNEEWIMITNAQFNLSQYNIIIDDKSTISIDYIKRKSRLLKKKGMCSMILIDYIQLAKEDGLGKNTIREQEVALMSRKCKNMAKELDVPVIILSQLNRDVEKRPNKRPMAADLRESGSLEADSDIVILLYRPEFYGFLEDEDGNSTKGIGQIIIEKNKEGKTGTVPFKYNESLTVISDPDVPLKQVWDNIYIPNSFSEPNADFLND